MATEFWQTVLVTQVGIYVLLAIGLNVVVGWAGLLDLGFIAFYAIGSYTTAYFTVGCRSSRRAGCMAVTPLLAIPFAVVDLSARRCALGAPTLRLRGDYLAIVTLGFGEIIRIIANNANERHRRPARRFDIPRPRSTSVRSTSMGRQRARLLVPPARAHRDHRDPLQPARGLPPRPSLGRHSRGRGGRPGDGHQHDPGQAAGLRDRRFDLRCGRRVLRQPGRVLHAGELPACNSILVVAYVVFGGMGSLPGAMAGAAVLTWLPEFLKDQVPAEDRQMWIGALILLMMIFRPAGLIPAKRRKAELTGLDAPATAETSAVPRRGGDVRMTASQKPSRRGRRRGGVRRQERDAAFRRRHFAQQRVAADAPRRDPRGHRPQRRRQDLAVQLADRCLHPQEGTISSRPVTATPRRRCSARRPT